jgi:hypothetical protein
MPKFSVSVFSPFLELPRNLEVVEGLPTSAKKWYGDHPGAELQ